jgi:SAM-dependent methyltransferase
VFVEHFKNYAENILASFNFGSNAFVVDIGSNDGTFLKFFKERGCRVLGIDPATNIAKQASADGIETWPDFFNAVLAEKIAAQCERAQIITANNVFAHTDEMIGFTKGVQRLLAPEGVFAFEVSYLGDVIEKTLFDTIYHEHLAYHAVTPLQSFLRLHDLEIIDVHRVDSHGGSIRVYSQHVGGPHLKQPSVDAIIDEEKVVGLTSMAAFSKLAAQIDKMKADLSKVLSEIKSASKSIAAFGAPAKATTLMYHFGLDASTIEFIVDDSPLKQGLYSPGLHVPVISADEMYQRAPDYLIILAWNFAEAIMNNHKQFLENGGHFIVPVPEVKVY